MPVVRAFPHVPRMPWFLTGLLLSALLSVGSSLKPSSGCGSNLKNLMRHDTRHLGSTGMYLVDRPVQMISNGGLLCSWNKGSCRRSFGASSADVTSSEHSRLPGTFHTKPARPQVRGEVVNTTVSKRRRELTTRGVRVVCLSAGHTGSHPQAMSCT